MTHLETQFHSWASESPYILMTEGGGQTGELTLLGHRMGSSFLPAFLCTTNTNLFPVSPFFIFILLSISLFRPQYYSEEGGLK